MKLIPIPIVDFNGKHDAVHLNPLDISLVKTTQHGNVVIERISNNQHGIWPDLTHGETLQLLKQYGVSFNE